MNLDKNEIAKLTEEYGGEWGINHTRRLLHLIDHIGEGLQYDSDVVWVAAHLHDWGAYPPFAHKDVDHVLRSAQVVRAYLEEHAYADAFIEHVLQCVSQHHQNGPKGSLEAVLLFDADVLDFLGVVGVLRDFSKNPKDLRKAFQVTSKRRETLPAQLVLETSKVLAAVRLAEMDELLSRFERDSWSCF
jgi:uncharacterized protein